MEILYSLGAKACAEPQAQISGSRCFEWCLWAACFSPPHSASWEVGVGEGFPCQTVCSWVWPGWLMLHSALGFGRYLFLFSLLQQLPSGPECKEGRGLSSSAPCSISPASPLLCSGTRGKSFPAANLHPVCCSCCSLPLGSHGRHHPQGLPLKPS